MTEIVIEEEEDVEVEDLESEDLDESEKEQEKDGGIICYKGRLKKLVKEIAISEGLVNIRLSRLGQIRLQQKIKFLASVLMIEIIDRLKEESRITIMPRHVDDALTKMLEGADGLSIAMVKLEEVTNQLRTLNQNTSMDRAFKFVDELEVNEESKI